MKIAPRWVTDLSREIEPDNRLVEAIAADLLRRCSRCGRLDWARAGRFLNHVVNQVGAEAAVTAMIAVASQACPHDRGAAASRCRRRRGEGVAPPAGHPAANGRSGGRRFSMV